MSIADNINSPINDQHDSKDDVPPMSGQHHSYDTGLARIYGIEAAILIHHFQHWIGVNQRLGRNFKEERTWTYQTKEEILAHFSYFTYDTVRRTLEKLIKKGVLLKKNFNKCSFDKTLWYAFANEKAFMPDTDSNKDYERQKRPSTGENAHGMGQNARPIPDTIPDTKTTDKGSSNPRAPVTAAPAKFSVTATAPPLIKKIEYRPKVFFTEAEYQIAEKVHGTTKLNGILDLLALKLTQKDYKYFLETIMPGGWVYKAYEEKNVLTPKPDNGASDLAETNRQWFKSVMHGAERPNLDETYRTTPDYVAFRNLKDNETEKCKAFKDSDFKQFVISNLRARKYKEKK